MPDMDQLFYGMLAMNAVFASLAWCLARPNTASILAVVIFAALWAFANGPLEGRTLAHLTPGHGVTASDMISVLAVVIATVQAVRVRRRARRSPVE